MNWLTKDFHVSDMGSELLTQTISERSLTPQAVSRKSVDFQQVREKVKQYFKDKHSKLSEHDLKRWRDLQHDAVIGKEEAKTTLMEEIERFLRLEQITLPAPYPYDSTVEAIFQETFGLGVISTWWKHPRFYDSQSARIICSEQGGRVFFEIAGEKSKRDFGYKSLDDIYTIIEKIRLKDEFASISKYDPKLEIDLADGTRIMIMIPPRVRFPVIVFRNYTMRKPTLEQFVRRRTFTMEALPIVEGIGRSMLNIAFLGKVRSGKSTLLKAMFGIRLREGQVAVNIERNHAELRLQEMRPDEQIIEMIVKTDKDYEEVFDQVLRSDYHICVISELRSMEAELFNLASERGEGGSMTSYHTDKVANMPGQIARLILQRFPNRKYEEELIRVADNLDIAFVMRELPGGAKRLDKVCEIQLDPYTLEVKVVDLIRYDTAEKDYRYYAGYSKRFKAKLLEVEGYGQAALNTLDRLAKEKPILDNAIEVALSHVVKRKER